MLTGQEMAFAQFRRQAEHRTSRKSLSSTRPNQLRLNNSTGQPILHIITVTEEFVKYKHKHALGHKNTFYFWGKALFMERYGLTWTKAVRCSQPALGFFKCARTRQDLSHTLLLPFYELYAPVRLWSKRQIWKKETNKICKGCAILTGKHLSAQ